MIKERILAWYERALDKGKEAQRHLPKQILFYRGGVSESQCCMVRHEELPQIRAGCEDALAVVNAGLISEAPRKRSPKLTLIVVTKRLHARFYPYNDIPRDEEGTDKDRNLSCGVVADTKVVTPNHFSFYLQSHDSPKGTAKNGHYVVIYDDSKFDAKTLHEIVSLITPYCITSSNTDFHPDTQRLLHWCTSNQSHFCLHSGPICGFALRSSKMLHAASLR